jgi:hypothetical protein
LLVHCLLVRSCLRVVLGVLEWNWTISLWAVCCLTLVSAHSQRASLLVCSLGASPFGVSCLAAAFECLGGCIVGLRGAFSSVFDVLAFVSHVGSRALDCGAAPFVRRVYESVRLTVGSDAWRLAEVGLLISLLRVDARCAAWFPCAWCFPLD